MDKIEKFRLKSQIYIKTSFFFFFTVKEKSYQVNVTSKFIFLGGGGEEKRKKINLHFPALKLFKLDKVVELLAVVVMC